MFDIANQLPTHHLPFTPFCPLFKWLKKHSEFSIQGFLSNFFIANQTEMLKQEKK